MCLANATAPVGADPSLPQLVKQEAPKYPAGAQRRGIEGWVSVQFKIDSTGHVDAPQVVEGSPPGVFDAAAIEAVSKWRYRAPAHEISDVQIKIRFKP